MTEVRLAEDILDKIVLLLRNNGERKWAFSLERCKSNLSQDPVGTSSIILAMYGGMGSLNDIVLYGNGQPLIKENQELDSLKSELYSYCQTIK